ncbi:hypothetical protein VE04_08485 [Pseudogymnoascus sp. 24MN13]|nr:hypothetical protein VE04_08485 [Pseudogymnoascus sp. 24MN13]
MGAQRPLRLDPNDSSSFPKRSELPKIPGAMSGAAWFCKYLNRPLVYPLVNDISYVNHVDGRMMGRAFIWACTSPNAHGQSFNLDNGDVWEFRSMWHVLSRYYNVPLAAKDESFTLAIVDKFGLRTFTLEDLAGQSVQNVDIQMNNCEEHQKLGGGRVWIKSRVKLTQAGFTDCVDTEEMAVHYFDQMATDKLLPTRKQLDGM